MRYVMVSYRPTTRNKTSTFSFTVPHTLLFMSHVFSFLKFQIFPTTVWRARRLRMEERPPDMECGWKYIDYTVEDSR